MILRLEKLQVSLPRRRIELPELPNNIAHIHPQSPLPEKDGEGKDTSTLEEKLLETPGNENIGNDTPRSIPRSTSMSSLASAGLLDNPQEVCVISLVMSFWTSRF